ncbi:MAG: hypothetical protein P4L10_12825, partial [Acidobacteriaceae bacterium]|nr:hypothetical protein [Acidobacteriaceae bacterium]
GNFTQFSSGWDARWRRNQATSLQFLRIWEIGAGVNGAARTAGRSLCLQRPELRPKCCKPSGRWAANGGVSWSTSQIMRTLLKRASYLFWQYPVLWLPVLAADVLKFWVVAGGHSLSHIVTLAMLPHSVLTGTVYPPFGSQMMSIYLVGGFFTWGTNFCGVALYCWGLGILVKAISALPATRELENPKSKLEWGLPNGWLRYSLSILLAYICAVAVWDFIAFYCFPNQFRRWDPSFTYSSLLMILMAVFLSISPLRAFISRNLTASIPTNDQIKLDYPRSFTCLIAGAFCIVYFLFWRFTTLVSLSIFHGHSIFYRPVISYPIYMIGSLVQAIPFIFGMIVFILIVQQEARESRDIPQGDESPVDGWAGSL